MINAFKPQSTEDIENRIEELAKSYVPEWKFDRRNPDAGSVIAQIFARQTEENNRLMSQMPERYHIEFVNMIDATLRSAQPSASIVVFNLEGGSTVGTQIPKGTRLSAESDESESGYVVFETGKNIFVTDSRIKSVFMTDAEDGTISPLFGNFDIPDIIAKNQMIIDDEEEEVNGEISDEDIPEIYEPTEVPPFTLFGEKKTIGKSILIMYHDRLFDGIDEEIYVRIRGAKELVKRIEEKKITFKYLCKKGFVPFDSVKLSEDGETFILVKSRECKKVRLNDKESAVVILEYEGVMNDSLEAEKVLLSAAGDMTIPEYVGDGSIEMDSARFNPFSDELAVYNECYIGHDPCFAKRGAKITLKFKASYRENHLRISAEQEEAELAVIKRKPQKTPMDNPVFARVDEIIIEYFNGIGWKKLRCDSEYAGMFAEAEAGEYTISFTCPGDWEQTENGPYSGRALRMRITKSDNCYLRPGIHVYPVIENLKIAYSYEGKYVMPLKTERIAGTKKEDITGALSGEDPVTLLSGTDYHEDALYIGLDRKLTEGPVSIYFQLADTANQNGIRCKLEYSGANGFTEMKFTDLTEDFTRSGTFMFLPPSDMSEKTIEGNRLYWLKISRARAQKSDFNDIFLPNIVKLCLNAVEVVNVQTSDEKDYYIEEVMPNTSVVLGSDNILDARVWVNEKGYTRKEEMERLLAEQPERVRAEYDFLGRVSAFYVLWNETESFEEATDRRSYRIDRMNGTIIFSDGSKCDMPRVTDDIAFKAVIRSTDGEKGNLSEGEINGFIGNAPYIDSVYNPIRAHGGSNLETIDHALVRCAGIMHSRWKLVSETDYVRFVKEFSDSIDKTKVVVGQMIDSSYNPADISVALLMKDFADGAFSFHRIAAPLKKEILKNCELTVTEENLHIVEPIFVDVSVCVWAMVMDMDDSFEVINEVKNIMTEYLNPVSSTAYDGWDFGVLPKESQILMRLGELRKRAVIQRITMLGRYVDAAGEHELDLRDIDISPFMVARSGEHKVIITNK